MENYPIYPFLSGGLVKELKLLNENNRDIANSHKSTCWQCIDINVTICYLCYLKIIGMLEKKCNPKYLMPKPVK